jgi:galactokinase
MNTVPEWKATVRVPGRVNLIGEHIDYHNLAVLPMAIDRQVEIRYRPRTDRRVRAVSSGRQEISFALNEPIVVGEAGDWGNYVKAAARATQWKWRLAHGADLAVRSTLPAAAGLSSSSALLAGCTLALLGANDIQATFEELMEVLPEGEHFVGTRGGGMDHAAVLGSRTGCALKVEFAPTRATHVPLPPGWSFLVANSLIHAEKSGPAREAYNSRRRAGTRGLAELGFETFADALARYSGAELRERAAGLEEDQRLCFLHVAEEARRVDDAVAAIGRVDEAAFGQLLLDSHASLRDQLRVSCDELNRLVEAAMASGALGARLTGAGFGGCAVVFCRATERERVREGLEERFYGRPAANSILDAEPAAGALELLESESEPLP